MQRSTAAAQWTDNIAGEMVASAALDDPSDGAEAAHPRHGDADDRYSNSLVIEALRHVYGDLLFHSEERNVYMRYFLFVFGALATGFGHAYETGQFSLAAFAAILSASVSSIFLLMDVRHVSRIQVALEAVVKLQDIIANKLHLPELRMARRARSRLGALLRWIRMARFFSPIQILFWIGLVVSLGAFCITIEGLKTKNCALPAGDRMTIEICNLAKPVTATLEKVAPFFGTETPVKNPGKRRPPVMRSH